MITRREMLKYGTAYLIDSFFKAPPAKSRAEKCDELARHVKRLGKKTVAVRPEKVLTLYSLELQDAKLDYVCSNSGIEEGMHCGMVVQLFSKDGTETIYEDVESYLPELGNLQIFTVRKGDKKFTLTKGDRGFQNAEAGYDQLVGRYLSILSSM